MIAHCPVPLLKGEFCQYQQNPFGKQKSNFSQSALFHMKTKVSLEYFVNDCKLFPSQSKIYTILYYTIHYTILYYTILYYIILYYTIISCFILQSVTKIVKLAPCFTLFHVDCKFDCSCLKSGGRVNSCQASQVFFLGFF